MHLKLPIHILIIFLLPALLAAQALWLYGQESCGNGHVCLDRDMALRGEPSNTMSLLQVSAEKKLQPSRASSNSASGTEPISLHAEMSSQVGRDNEQKENENAAMQLADVTFGVLGSSIMVLDKPEAMPKGNNAIPKGREWRPAVTDISPLTWVFGSYHKSGCALALGICYKLSGHQDANKISTQIEELREKNKATNQAFNSQPFSNEYFEPNVGVIRNLPDYRFVHMIRLPANLIISAYHWHKLDPWKYDTEWWLQHPVLHQWCWGKAAVERGKTKCPHDDVSNYGALPEILQDPSSHYQQLVHHKERLILDGFNQSIHSNMTLPQYYWSVKAIDGIVVEAYRSLWTVNLMLDNFDRTRFDDKTVQVSMESVQNNFTAAMLCTFSFLHQSHDFDIDWAMKQVDRLDVTKYGANASGDAPWHVSSPPPGETERLMTRLNEMAFVAGKTKDLQRYAKNAC